MLIAARCIPVMQAQVWLADVGATVSMSRTGTCYDNEVTESFFGAFKGACIERTAFQTRGQARQSIVRVCRVLLQPDAATFLVRV
jgi:transposase InsO family protein